MRKRYPIVCAGLIALGSAVGCGGKTASSAGGPEGVDGPLSSCGDSCSPAQVSDSCSTICDRIAQSGCSSGSDSGSCTMDCANLVSMNPSCAAPAYAFLRCIETLEPTCSDSGVAEYAAACDAQQQAVEACLNQGGPPVTTPTAGAGGTVPSDVCPNIPRPAAALGSCSASGSAGPSASPACTTSCNDVAGNVWLAECTGSTCTCTYNATDMCTCQVAAASPGACVSCCPGAQ